MPLSPRLTRLPRLLALPLALALLLGASAAPAAGAPTSSRTLVPVGAGYSEITLQRFALAAAQRDTSGTVSLLVLPITFGTDPFATSAKERRENLALAETRRGQVEAACNAVKRAGQLCRAVLAPILVRDDAFVQANLDLFVPDLDGMYILGGDQTVAMQVVADTPTEQRMAAAYAAGAVVGGNSAGAAVQSLAMIAGYVGDNGPENGMQQGAVDLWLPEGQADRTRGLIFGLPDAIAEQHTFQRGRIGRLLSAAWSTGLVGVGVDADTGAVIVDEARITDVAGATAAIVVDQRTYGSAGRYAGPTRSLALSRVATHLVPPGGFGFDLARLRPLVGGQPQPAPTIGGRSFGQLRLPAGYGPLLLGGDIGGDKGGAAALRFVQRSGGAGARIVVLTAGYAKGADAQADAKAYAAAFQGLGAGQVQWFVLDARANQTAIQSALSGAGGVFLAAADQSLVMGALEGAPAVTAAVRAAWQRGAALMADGAGAATLGQTMSTDPPPTAAGLEDDSMADFLVSGVTTRPGLGFVPGLMVEPRLLPDRHWGRMYNLAARGGQALALGIDVGTAVELTQAGGRVVGQSVAVTLDGRQASFSVGSNGALGARYVILDSFVDGDVLAP